MDLLINLIGVFVALIVVVYTYFKWTYQYWKRKGVPYFEPKIPLGNTPTEVMTFPDYMRQFYRTAKSNGWRYCGLYLDVTVTLVIVDLDLLKLIMTKDFKHFVDRGLYTNEHGEPLTTNMATVDGQRWKTLRPKLTPSFSSGKLKSMFQTIANSGLKLEAYIADYSKNNEPVDTQTLFERFAIDVIGSCAFGIECNTFTDPNSPFVTFSKRHMNRTRWETVKATGSKRFPNLFRILGVKVINRDVTNFFTNLVKDTINYRKKKNIRRNDFMQILIDLLKENHVDANAVDSQLTIDEIVSQCFLFFNAGFQTSSATLTYALFELTQDLDVQAKLRKEIAEVLAKNNNEISYDMLTKLTYMEQVIKETLRMHIPIPIIGRSCSEDYKIPGTDVVIEKGTKVSIPAIAIHYDEEYYPDPEKFDPERFSEENLKNINPYTFIPFGEGPRICVGVRFAMLEAKVGLTYMLRNYKVKLNEQTHLPIQKSLTPTALTRLDQKIWIDLEKE